MRLLLLLLNERRRTTHQVLFADDGMCGTVADGNAMHEYECFPEEVRRIKNHRLLWCEFIRRFKIYTPRNHIMSSNQQ